MYQDVSCSPLHVITLGSDFCRLSGLILFALSIASCCWKSMKRTIFYDGMPCIPVGVCRRFTATSKPLSAASKSKSSKQREARLETVSLVQGFVPCGNASRGLRKVVKLLDVYTEGRENLVKSYKMHASSCSYLKRLFCILMDDVFFLKSHWFELVCYFKFNITSYLCKLVNIFSNNSLFLLFCTFVKASVYATNLFIRCYVSLSLGLEC
jgi:hypothetical protein